MRVPRPTGHTPLLKVRRFPRFAVLLVTLAAGVDVATAQAPAPSRGLPRFRDEWRWVDFGPESGLPPGPVEEMVEVDSVPWVRTPEGVAWYDGFQWRPARVDGERIAGGATSLTRDAEGVVFVVQGGAVYRGGIDGLRHVPLEGVDSSRASCGPLPRGTDASS